MESPDQDDSGNSQNFRNDKDLDDIKWLLREKMVEVGVPFNTNVLRIALNIKEEKLAAILAAYY